MKLIFLIWLCSLIVFGQGVEAPLSGFVVDAGTSSIRPIQGFPGAAVLGAAVVLDFSVKRAIFSSKADAALVVDVESDQLWVLHGLKRGPLVASKVDGALKEVDLWSWSESGTSAVLYSRLTSEMQILSGLPTLPEIASTKLLKAAAGEILSIAIDRSGRQILVAAAEQSGGAIYRITNDGDSTERLASASRPTLVTWARSDQDALYVDSELGELTLLENAGSTNALSVLTSARDALGKPVAIQVQEGRALLLTESVENSLAIGHLIEIELASRRIVATLTLPDSARKLIRMDESGLFVLNEVGEKPLYLFSSKESTLWFVPQVIR